jgi:hypothetical protein
MLHLCDMSASYHRKYASAGHQTMYSSDRHEDQCRGKPADQATLTPALHHEVYVQDLCDCS